MIIIQNVSNDSPMKPLRAISSLLAMPKTFLGVPTHPLYYWRELPQVLFLSRQKFCRYKHVFVETKHVFCRDKSMLAVTKLLSRQNHVCRDKICLSRQAYCFIMFHFTRVLSQQTRVCRDRSKLVATKICLSRQTYFFFTTKDVFVATKLLSRQK